MLTARVVHGLMRRVHRNPVSRVVSNAWPESRPVLRGIPSRCDMTTGGGLVHFGVLALTLGVAVTWRSDCALPAGHGELRAMLLDPLRRDDAFCSVVQEAQRWDPTGSIGPKEDCAVNHVVEARQRSGSSLFVVFWRADRDVFPEAGSGLPKGPFTIISDDGAVITEFLRADVLEADSAIVGLGSDGLAIIQAIPYGAAGALWTTLVLHVVPVTPEQRSILTVMVGPPVTGFVEPGQWTWRVRHALDGELAIDVGTSAKDGDGLKVEGTYRFNAAANAFVGPAGGPDRGFQRVQAVDVHRSARRWARNFLWMAEDFQEDLPVRIVGTIDAGTPRLTMAYPRWPRRNDQQAELLMDFKGPCPLRHARLSRLPWSATMSGNHLRAVIPVATLREMSGDTFELEVVDGCRTRVTTWVSVP